MPDPDSDKPYEALDDSEKKERAEEVYQEAVQKMADHLAEHDVPANVVVIGNLPPDYRAVRFKSNLGDEDMARLVLRTAQVLEGRFTKQSPNGGPDDNIITPG